MSRLALILLAAASLLFSLHAVPAEQALCDEIANDPLARGYSGMTPSQISADLNTAYRTRWLDCVEGSALLDDIEVADWNNITDDERNRTLAILALGCMDPQKNVRQLMIGIFGSGSTTLSNMAATAQESITRAQELGINDARTARVQECP